MFLLPLFDRELNRRLINCFLCKEGLTLVLVNRPAGKLFSTFEHDLSPREGTQSLCSCLTSGISITVMQQFLNSGFTTFNLSYASHIVGEGLAI